MSMRRIERLERASSAAAVDWRDHLPDGVTLAEAEAALETWARLTAHYADANGVSIEAAAAATRGALAALLASGATLEDEFDDDDEEDDDE